MVFSSLIFLFFFLPAVLFCYYIVPQNFIRVRNAVLLLFSLFFYFYGEPRLIGMLIFSILMNYLFGLSMRSTYKKAAAHFVRYRQSEPAGCIQVSEFLHQLSGQPVRAGYSGAGYRHADRHFVLHVSGAQLRH